MRMYHVEVIRDRQFGRRRDATQDVGDAEEPRANLADLVRRAGSGGSEFPSNSERSGIV